MNQRAQLKMTEKKVCEPEDRATEPIQSGEREKKTEKRKEKRTKPKDNKKNSNIHIDN